MSDQPQPTDEPLLFPVEEIPKMAVPVSEASPEWQDALTLKMVEAVRFNPERLAHYRAEIAVTAPGVDPVEFLDYMIERAGGRSQ